MDQQEEPASEEFATEPEIQSLEACSGRKDLIPPSCPSIFTGILFNLYTEHWYIHRALVYSQSTGISRALTYPQSTGISTEH